MSRTRKLALAALAAVVGLSFNVFGVAPPGAPHGTPAFAAQAAPADPTITITNEGLTFPFSPAQVYAKVGQTILITNKDPNWIHNVRAENNAFGIDIYPQGSVYLRVSKPGRYPYYCDYHPYNHNPATLVIT